MRTSLMKWFRRVNMTLLGWVLAADPDDSIEDETDGAPKFFYGGQAVMEGVMMRSAYSAAVAVRSPKLIAIDGYDPVAYFAEGAAVPGSEEFQHKWMDAYWRFSSEENRAAFEAEPERYAPQYGGHCAYAMRAKTPKSPDPEAWAVHDGRLYLFADAEARAAFESDFEGNVAAANMDWAEVKKKQPAALGEIMVHEQPLSARIYRGWLPKVPLLRGLIMLWDSLGLGSRALMWSADIALSEEEEAESISFSGPLGIGTLVVSLALGIGLFVLLPAGIAKGIEQATGIDSAVLTNIVEGLIRLLLVIAYIWVIGRIPDIKRLFAYHGAEHKTINAYEDGAPLVPESVARYPVEHTRCGTGFLLVVVVVSVFVFAFMGHFDNLLLRLGSRILLIPLVAGIAYEWIRFAAQHVDNPVVAALIKPNLWLQHLTTNEPTLDIIEVGIVSLKRVLVAEPTLKEPVPEPAIAGD